MIDLVMTGPYIRIRAYGHFAIHVDFPSALPASGEGESSGSPDAAGGSGTLKWEWEWDGYDPFYAAQVDNPKPIRQTIGQDAAGRRMEIVYLVLSNAVEAWRPPSRSGRVSKIMETRMTEA